MVRLSDNDTTSIVFLSLLLPFLSLVFVNRTLLSVCLYLIFRILEIWFSFFIPMNLALYPTLYLGSRTAVVADQCFSVSSSRGSGTRRLVSARAIEVINLSQAFHTLNRR